MTTLAENLQAENGLGEIHSTCLSVTEQSMWPDTLSDLFGRIGIQRIWEEVGKQADMKILFQLEREDGVSREAKAKLSNLMQDRNQIAHPSVSTIFPDADQVIDYISFPRIFAQVLIQICRVKVVVFSVKEKDK